MATYSVRICKRCGDEFIPKSSRQMYCKQTKIFTCRVCGTTFEDICGPEMRKICFDLRCKKKAATTSHIIKKCRMCGQEFTPVSARQLDCKRTIIKKCEVCDNEFETICSKNVSQHTCSNKCFQVYLSSQQMKGLQKLRRICEACGHEFTPTHGSQRFCSRDHFKKCEICGQEFKYDPTDPRRTCSSKCHESLRFKDGNPFSRSDFREKARKTYKEKTGYDHPMHNPETIRKMKGTYFERTGYTTPAHNPEVRSKSCRKISSLEIKVMEILEEYHIEYVHHEMICKSDKSHEYDFYLPKYHLFIDVDGLYFHSYLDDPNGEQVNDYYDETRFAILPEDCRLHIIVEGNEERDIKILMHTLFENGPEYYDSEIFKWCRGVGFPYPSYPKERLEKDYKHLSERYDVKYVPQARLGDSIIRHYHKSLWDAHVKGYVSPREAWEDDKLLRKVIANRLIYINDVDPSKVLRGFNVSKIAPRVSVFNPVLAKYLTDKYLSEFTTIIDPFSGWSGRLLGVTACGKQYIGWDLNKSAVKESNHIIQDWKLDAIVTTIDTLSVDLVNHDAGLLTCPPYADKEYYSNESIFLDPSDWIHRILNQIQVPKYVFVVDNPGEYWDCVEEEISTTSHMSTHTEFVVVIDRNKIS